MRALRRATPLSALTSTKSNTYELHHCRTGACQESVERERKREEGGKKGEGVIEGKWKKPSNWAEIVYVVIQTRLVPHRTRVKSVSAWMGREIDDRQLNKSKEILRKEFLEIRKYENWKYIEWYRKYNNII